MNEEKKVSILDRIKAFFKKIFNPQKTLTEDSNVKDEKVVEKIKTDDANNLESTAIEQEKEVSTEDSFLSDLRDDYKKTEDENYIVKAVEDNPELIKTLPIKRVEQLEKILDKRIAEEKRKNEELEKEIESLNRRISIVEQ